MKLIDAPIGIFRFDGELVLKTEYCSENKLSGKYIPDCYIVRTGEYFWGDAKTANELNNLDVEPVDFAELLPTVTDTISRQAAIEAMLEYGHGRAVYIGVDTAVGCIDQLPPAQPEIVRCKDCKYWNSGSCEYPEHAVNCQDYWVGDIETEAEHFCGYAKRREVTE